MSFDGDVDDTEWSEIVADMRENWSKAEIVREERGRKQKRAKSGANVGKWRSMTQRVFAAGVLHSIHVYPSLRQFEREIRVMLFVRGMIDEAEAKHLRCADGSGGARPGSNDVVDESAVVAWLDSNAYVPGHDDDHHACNRMGCHRLRVVNDLLKSRRDQEGLRVFHELEQFCAWAYLWADHSFELRWLGRTVGFGLFTTGTAPAGKMRIHGVADYEVRDPHAQMQTNPNKRWRDAGWRSKDYVSVYGPLTLVNAACDRHSSVDWEDDDIRCKGKLVSLKWKPGRAKGMHSESTQVYASYPATKGSTWLCQGLKAPKTCHRGVGK
jgi:hypothetical protein